MMVVPYKNLRGADILFKKLVEFNVSKIFAYSGGAIMPAVDQLHKSNNKKIDYYINTHEQSAGHAATAYARTSGKVGICMMTSGPGVTNMITPLTDATNDSTPLILFSGNVPLKAIGSNAFQEVPATDITRPITKWSYLVKSIFDLPEVVNEAFKVATNGKMGSVHIDLPKCILEQKYTQDFLFKRNFYNRFQITKRQVAKNYNCLKIIHLLNICERPVIIAGQGCNNYSGKLFKFAQRGNIPVTTTIHGLGVFDESHELSLEFLGMHGNAAANYAIQRADLIIGLGTRFDDRITGNVEKYAPEAYKAFKENRGGIVNVNINGEEKMGIVSHFNYHMDCGKFMDGIEPFYRLRKPWFDEIAKLKRENQFSYKVGKKLKTQQVIECINETLNDLSIKDYIITTGVGNHQMMTCQFIKWRRPNSLVTSGSLGVMGVGLPFAIGSQLANPKMLVIDIDGDGSFNHTLSELKTVMNYNLPIKIAIMNDTCLSMVNTWEKLFYDERYTATDLKKNPNYVKLAKAYGIKAISCSNKLDLNKKVREFLRHEGPILCEFKVEGDQCLPLVPPNAALDEMILE